LKLVFQENIDVITGVAVNSNSIPLLLISPTFRSVEVAPEEAAIPVETISSRLMRWYKVKSKPNLLLKNWASRPISEVVDVSGRGSAFESALDDVWTGTPLWPPGLNPYSWLIA